MESEGVQGAAAAWYPDPLGRHQYRYWDGASWTKHVATDGKQGVDPLAASSPVLEEADETSLPEATAAAEQPAAACPNCLDPLDKMPGRKKQCPHCGEFMYVRTRPTDKQRVVVTERGASEIDSEWEKVRINKRLMQSVDEAEFQKTKAALSAKFGRPASDDDVFWSIHNKHLLQHARRGDWGFYRNTRLNMAMILAAEGKGRAALDTYFEVVYLDVNGPNNRGGLSDPQLLREFPPFTPESAFVAPGVISEIAKLQRLLGLSGPDTRAAFVVLASKVQQRMKLSVSPEQAWQLLPLSQG